MSCRYAKERKAFDKPISTLYAIQEKIAKMSYKVDASRLLIHKAAMLKDAGKPFTKDAAQAKLVASEAATFNAHQAIQTLGGMGYVSTIICDACCSSNTNTTIVIINYMSIGV